MAPRPRLRHGIGVAAVGAASVAFILLTSRRLSRDLSFIYIIVALVPLGLWAVPAYLRGLARTCLRVHRTVAHREGFYVRAPCRPNPSFRKTVGMALGPFAVDLLLIAQVLYIQDSWDVQFLRAGLVAFLVLLVLTGLLTSLPPGAWLLDALEVRYVDPGRGAVHRVADLFERALGPIGAGALLASFITLLTAVGFSYEAALLLLAVWMARLFPPVLAVTAIYRFVLEPRILPSLEAHVSAERMPTTESLPDVLESIRPERSHRSRPETPQEPIAPLRRA